MKIPLLRCHALMVEDGVFSHKLDYLKIYLEILNLEGHPNRITGSRVTPILLTGWILPSGGASAVEGLRSAGLPRLVFVDFKSGKALQLHYWVKSDGNFC